MKQKNVGYVVVSEPNPLRRKMALEMGADFVIDPRGENYQEDLEKLRGKWHKYKSINIETDIKVLVSYHPAFLLRSPNFKKGWRSVLQIFLYESKKS